MIDDGIFHLRVQSRLLDLEEAVAEYLANAQPAQASHRAPRLNIVSAETEYLESLTNGDFEMARAPKRWEILVMSSIPTTNGIRHLALSQPKRPK